MKTNTIYFTLLMLISTQVFSAGLSWINPPGIDIGLEGDSEDYNPIISNNGRYVAYTSYSSNLVLNDTNSSLDIFLKDLQTGTTILVNSNQNGEQFSLSSTNSFSNPSNNGRYIAVFSRDENLPHRPIDADFFDLYIYIKDNQTGVLHTPLFNAEAVTTSESKLILSANGRYLYFTTEDSLVINDTNTTSDAYIYDRQDSSFSLISIAHDGNAAGRSSVVSVSNNGRYINFRSFGEVLSGTTGSHGYIRDLNFSTTNIYTLDELGNPASSGYLELAVSDVSNNGSVYFCSDNEDLVATDSNDLADFFIYEAGVVSLFPFPGLSGSITDIGCYASRSKIIVNNDGTKFYFNHASNQIDTSISYDGYKIIFVNLTTQQSKVINQIDNEVFYVNINLSGSNNLNDIALSANTTFNNPDIQSTQQKALHFNTQNNAFNSVSTAAFSPDTQNASVVYSGISEDQNWVTYFTEADNVVVSQSQEFSRDLYLLNRSNSQVLRIGNNVEYDIDMSPDGRYVVFISEYSQGASHVLLDDEYLFLYDRNNQSYLQIASAAEDPRVNNEGNVVFASENDNLVVNDDNDFKDVFLFIKNTSQIERISVNTVGNGAYGDSHDPDIAGSGTSTWIVFESQANDLIASDANGAHDVFMFNWPNGQISRISELSGVGGDNNSIKPRISKNTTTVSFLTYADNLVGEENPDLQVMAYDRVLNSLTLISRDHLGNIGDDLSGLAIPSPTGRYIAFNTESVLVSNDTDNHSRDVYVFDQQEQQMTKSTQYNNGDNYEGISILNDFVVDNSQSTPLLGVLFTNGSILINDYFNLGISLNTNKQLYLMQSGGDGNEVQVEIIGDGVVTGDSGFSCSDDCSQTYILGQNITLIASPSGNATFSHWQGDVCDNSTALTCDVHINNDKTIQAIFSGNDDVIFNNGFEN